MSDKPRLLVLTSTYPRWADDPEPGFVHELARRLVDEFEVTVLAPHAPGAATVECMDGVCVRRYRYAPTLLETLVNDGGIMGNLRRHRWKWLLVPGFLLAQAWSLIRLAAWWRPHVVHAHWLVPQGLVVALVHRLLPGKPPLFVTCHGADVHALRRWPLGMLKRFAASRSQLLAAVSRAVAATLEATGIPSGKILVEPMGTDLAGRFVPASADLRSGNEILFVGRLVEKKGLRHLIEALPHVLARVPDARLTVAGDGPERGARRRQVEDLALDGHVDFLGAVPQAGLPAMYQRATVFVAPFIAAQSGDQEGLGLVLVEAIGCGCPVIVGDVPAVRDVLGEDRTAVIDVRNPVRLAAAIVEVLQSPAEARAAAECRRAAVADFDWPRRASAYAALLGGGS